MYLNNFITKKRKMATLTKVSDRVAIALFKKKIQKSLAEKVENILKQLEWIDQEKFPIQKICDLFNILEKELSNINSREWEVAPRALKNVLRTSGRQENGWFRASQGERATIYNTYIVPTGHFDEFFNTLQLEKLLNINDKPSAQGGFASKPLNTQDFYFYTFVQPFAVAKYRALQCALSKLK